MYRSPTLLGLQWNINLLSGYPDLKSASRVFSGRQADALLLLRQLLELDKVLETSLPDLFVAEL